MIELPIIDAHHHLWRRPGSVYDADEFLRDLKSVPSVVGSVFIEAQLGESAPGAARISALSEIDLARAAGERARETMPEPGLCAAIVSYADLSADGLASTLEAQMIAAGGRLRGVRQKAAWHHDASIHPRRLNAHPNLLTSTAFQDGITQLRKHDLLFEAWVYHPQLSTVEELAGRFPDVWVVLEHAGGPLLSPCRTPGEREEALSAWSASMKRLSAHPNIALKISGLGMENLTGLGEYTLLDSILHRIVTECVETFGSARCMFGSNFPVDGRASSYREMWSAFDWATAQFSADERHNLFERTARRIYSI